MRRMDPQELLFTMALESTALGLIYYERAELRQARQYLTTARKGASSLKLGALVRSIDGVLGRIGHSDGLSTGHTRRIDPNPLGTPAERALHHLKQTGQTNQTLTMLQQAFTSVPLVPRTNQPSRRIARR